MGVIQPGRPLVIEVRERAFLQYLRGRFVFGKDAVRIALYHFRHTYDEVWRIQPVITQFIQPLGGGGDFLRSRIIGILGQPEYPASALRERGKFQRWLTVYSADHSPCQAMCKDAASRVHETASAESQMLCRRLS